LVRLIHAQLGLAAKVPLDSVLVYAAAVLCAIRFAFHALSILVLAASIGLVLTLARAPRAWRPALSVAFGAALVQLGLWLLIVPALAMVGTRTTLSSVARPDQVQSLLPRVQSSFVLHLTFAAAVGLAAFIVWVCRLVWSRSRPFLTLPEPYTYPVPPPELPRLLVHPSIVGVLAVLGAVGSVLSRVVSSSRR
jgi:hypothetical protein